MKRFSNSCVHDKLYGLDGTTVVGHSYTCTYCPKFVVTSASKDDAIASIHIHYVSRHLTGNRYATGAKRAPSGT
jgi:hypothetical protein